MARTSNTNHPTSTLDNPLTLAAKKIQARGAARTLSKTAASGPKGRKTSKKHADAENDNPNEQPLTARHSSHLNNKTDDVAVAKPNSSGPDVTQPSPDANVPPKKRKADMNPTGFDRTVAVAATREGQDTVDSNKALSVKLSRHPKKGGSKAIAAKAPRRALPASNLPGRKKHIHKGAARALTPTEVEDETQPGKSDAANKVLQLEQQLKEEKG